MQTYLPSLKQLQYLVALKDHGHFGRAADATYVTQSTLSAGVRELESALGMMLVERTRRVVRFTALGDQIIERARRVLREAEELAALAAGATKPLAGELRMSVIPTIAPFMLPAVLPALRRERPDLKLFLREEPSAHACDSLHHGQVDCVLLALPYACGDVESAVLFDDPLLVAFPGDFAGELPAVVSADMLDPAQLLMLEDGHCLKDHALAACNRPDLRSGARMVGTSLHTLVQMVDNGLGVTMLPQMALDAGILDQTDIDTRPLASDHDWRTIALVWRKNSPRAEEFALLAEVMQRLYRAGRA
ncbi:MAG: hydrogen peroxide-inducible genes activator [Sphingopyxis sp.]|nr:hydrogen peroxide-inducible genes activator [Sphingopyxis sp.]